MKVKTFSLITIIMFSNVALAALPPTAESLRRIKTITESKEVYDVLGSVNWVNSITESNDGYILQTGKCTLEVRIEAKPPHPQRIGPLDLEVKTGMLTCNK